MSAVFGSVAVGAGPITSTAASLPAANAVPLGFSIYVTDWGVNGTLARSNGTRWLPVGGSTVLKHLGPAVTGIGSTATIVIQASLPIGLFQPTDAVYCIMAFSKSGVTDSLATSGYLGTAGTTADAPVIPGANALAAAAQTGSAFCAIKLVTNTAAMRVGPISGGNLFTQTSTIAPATNVVVSDASANILIASFAIRSTAGNDTVAIQESYIYQVAG